MPAEHDWLFFAWTWFSLLQVTEFRDAACLFAWKLVFSAPDYAPSGTSQILTTPNTSNTCGCSQRLYPLLSCDYGEKTRQRWSSILYIPVPCFTPKPMRKRKKSSRRIRACPAYVLQSFQHSANKMSRFGLGESFMIEVLEAWKLGCHFVKHTARMQLTADVN